MILQPVSVFRDPDALHLSQLRFSIELTGAKDGFNQVYATPEPFMTEPIAIMIRVFLNGQRLTYEHDFLISESGGPGTGYDRIVLIDTRPLSFDELRADYMVQ